ncbi:hypothetical protein HAX54_041880 [Datura stramonium]|uniref:Uncharacterized protein n=1 Tax=Datura stramonium TaxID=4076 RepID=A0ABS8SLS2_DATST|nr:hypothetical protein [Datura stramonium]
MHYNNTSKKGKFIKDGTLEVLRLRVCLEIRSFSTNLSAAHNKMDICSEGQCFFSTRASMFEQQGVQKFEDDVRINPRKATDVRIYKDPRKSKQTPTVGELSQLTSSDQRFYRQ